jgi:hypothetical protein
MLTALGAGLTVVATGLLLPGEAMAAAPGQPSPDRGSLAPSADWSCLYANRMHERGEKRAEDCHYAKTPAENLKGMEECAKAGAAGARYLAPAGPEGVAAGAAGGCAIGSMDYDMHHGK